jgi:hypothetical protein
MEKSLVELSACLLRAASFAMAAAIFAASGILSAIARQPISGKAD